MGGLSLGLGSSSNNAASLSPEDLLHNASDSISSQERKEEAMLGLTSLFCSFLQESGSFYFYIVIVWNFFYLSHLGPCFLAF